MGRGPETTARARTGQKPCGRHPARTRRLPSPPSGGTAPTPQNTKTTSARAEPRGHRVRARSPAARSPRPASAGRARRLGGRRDAPAAPPRSGWKPAPAAAAFRGEGGGGGKAARSPPLPPAWARQGLDGRGGRDGSSPGGGGGRRRVLLLAAAPAVITASGRGPRCGCWRAGCA